MIKNRNQHRKKTMTHKALLLFTLLQTVTPELQSREDSVSSFIASMLDESVYDRRERPVPPGGGPTVVEVDMFISSISGISEITMDFSLNMFLRQRWIDQRLSFLNHPVYNTSLTLSYRFNSQLWVPDIFLKNEVQAGKFHEVPVPNILIDLSPDGGIIYSQRITTRLSCIMDLKTFPLDSQTCAVTFESYGFRETDIVLQWKAITPVAIQDGMVLPEFNVTDVTTGICTAKYDTGSFSCIDARFKLDRLFEYYLIQIYIPSILLVILSWVSFWIDIQAVPARVSLGLLTVLTITTQQSGLSTKLPRVSYIKSIDVWIFTCMVFVFGALIEYCAVNVLARRRKSWVDSLKRVWATQESHAKAIQVSALSQLPGLKMAFGNKPIKKDNKNSRTPPIKNGINLPKTVTSVSSTKNKNGNSPHKINIPNSKAQLNDFPTKPTSNIASIMEEANTETIDAEVLPEDNPIYQRLPYWQKLRGNSALLVDVISRVMFPLMFVIFSTAYWLYYAM